MGLLDGFEKLINEHGSAVILKERISLANDKYVALEARVTGLETEIIDLKAKKSALQAENQRLKVDNEQLTIKIQDLEKIPYSHDNLLDEEKVKILMALAKQEWSYAEHISRSLGIGIQVVQFHLDELQNDEMALVSDSMGDSSEWTLGHEGRRYLIKNKLIS